MKMKKILVVLFCMLVLNFGLSAGEETKGMKNCEKFDDFIKTAFAQYGPMGVHVELLSVSCEPITVPPYFCCRVMLWVEYVVKDPKPVEHTWYFCFGLLHHDVGDVPDGIRIINKEDRGKLIGCCKAAKIAAEKCNIQVDKAKISLYWVLYPECPEPYYAFLIEDNTRCIVGAFTGKVYKITNLTRKPQTSGG